MVSMAQEWRSPLASSVPVLPLGRIDLAEVMTKIPYVLSLETLFSPNPHPRQFRMTVLLPSFALNSSKLLSSGSLRKIPTGTRKC
jgi:hypothetical protein